MLKARINFVTIAKTNQHTQDIPKIQTEVERQLLNLKSELLLKVVTTVTKIKYAAINSNEG